MQKANAFLTDLIISKYAKILGEFDAIEDPEVLAEELRRDELLKRDVQRVVEMFSTYTPYLGILSRSVTTAKHVYNHKSKPDNECNNKDNETSDNT